MSYICAYCDEEFSGDVKCPECVRVEGATADVLRTEVKRLKQSRAAADAHDCMHMEEALAGTRADLAKAQARCAEMANALRKAEHAMCGAGGNGCFCRCPVIDGHGPGCELVAALASDGTSALASVRLAQRALDEVTGGAAIYGDGRLQDDMRAEILAAKAALTEAFGSGE